MTDDDRSAVATINRDELTVQKSISVAEESVAKVEFRFDSDADVPARVLLRDPLPDGWPRDQIGFHPEHDEDLWAIEGDEITYVQKLDPQADHRTLYAVQYDESDELEAFHVEPDVEVEVFDAGGKALESTHEDEDAFPPESAADRESSSGMIARDGERSDPAPDAAGMADTQPRDFPVLSAPDHAEIGMEPEEIRPFEQESGNSEASGTDENEDDVAPEGIVEELLVELEDLSPGRRSALRDALDIREPTSHRTRIERLEQEHAELTTYTDALREFLDEEGEARELMQRVRDRQDELSERVDSLSAEYEETVSETADMRERLDHVEQRVESIPSGLAGKVEALYDEFEHLEADHGDRLQTMEDRLDREIDELNETIVDRIDHHRTSLKEEIESTDGRMTERMDTFEDQVLAQLQEIEDDYCEAVAEVETDWESARADLERIDAELQTLLSWQANMQELFNSLGGDGESDES